MSARVATTQWSQVLTARDANDTAARRALAGLCQTYWPPLYAYIRHQGESAEDAKDLTQAYFTELLDKEFLAAVDPSKGRFRAFLLASLRHFLSHQRDKARRLKRGGGTFHLSLDLGAAEEQYAAHAVDEMTPEAVFEHRWAVTLLERAMARLERASRSRHHREQLETLKPYLTGEEPRVQYRRAAGKLGMTEGAVRVAVHRLRRRFGSHLRAEIAETVADTSEVDAEVRYLLNIVRL